VATAETTASHVGTVVPDCYKDTVFICGFSSAILLQSYLQDIVNCQVFFHLPIMVPDVNIQPQWRWYEYNIGMIALT